MTKGRLLAGFFCALSILFLAVLVPQVGEASRAAGDLGFYSVGPTALPYFAGAMVLLFSLAVLFTDRPARTGQAPSADDGQGDEGGLKRGFLFLLVFLAYSVFMPVAGFLIASVIFLFAIFAIYRVGSWVVACVVAVLTPLIVDLLLRKVFLIPLPATPFF